MASKYTQISLKPGRYHIGNGVYRDLSAKDLARYRDNTNAMLKAGVQVPLLLEHAQSGHDSGAPRYSKGKTRDQLASEVLNGAGWLDEAVIDEATGALSFALTVTAEEADKKMADGSIKFTSPEFRHMYQDGEGRIWRDVVGHVALTHQPRNTDQGGFTPVEDTSQMLAGASQFSLADLLPEGQQFATGDPFKKKPETEGKPDGNADKGETQVGTSPAGQNQDPAGAAGAENPDMPKGGGGNEQQQMDAILAHLTELGIPLPSDTNTSNFYDRLLTGLLVAEAQRMKAEAEAAEDEDGNEDDQTAKAVEAAKPPMQYSLAEIGTVGNPVLEKLVASRVTNMREKCDALIGLNKITPAVKAALLNKSDTMQFSAASGDELPHFTVGEVIDILDQGMVGGQFFAEQFANREEVRPDAQWATDKGPVGTDSTNLPEGDAAKEMARQQLEAAGYSMAGK